MNIAISATNNLNEYCEHALADWDAHGYNIQIRFGDTGRPRMNRVGYGTIHENPMKGFYG